MIKNLLFEWKKIVKNPVTWLLLLAFILFDIYKITTIYQQENKEISGHEKLYDALKGELTEEKISFLVEGYQSNKKLVENGNYSTEGGQDGTYTGYIFGDFSEFETFFHEYKYVYEYAQKAKNISHRAENNCELLCDDVYEVRLNRYICEKYKGRNLASYYDMKGTQKWLEYEFSTFFVFVVLLLIIPNLVQNEYDSKMEKIIKTTEYGYCRYGVTSILAIMLCGLFLLLIFRTVDYIVFEYLYDIQGVFQPLYSIQDYAMTPFNGNVLEYAFCLIFYQYVGLCFWSIVLLILTKVIRQGIWAIGITATMFAIMISVLMHSKCVFNPILLFVGYHFFQEYNVIKVANYPVDIGVANVMLFLGIILLTIKIILVLEKKQSY